MAYWLIKTEPAKYGIDDLVRDKTTLWDGIRNYQARNYLRQMKTGDVAFLYHSCSKERGIVGKISVIREAFADPLQFNPESRYFDPKSDPDAPRWSCVEIKLETALENMLPLKMIREHPGLSGLPLVKTGSLLSVMPVSPREWAILSDMIQQL